MNIATRRLVALAATAALVSVPAIALIGEGGSASASAGVGAGGAGVTCRTSTPDGLLDTLLGGLLGGGTASPGSAGPVTDPVTGLPSQIGAILGTPGTSTPSQLATDITNAIATLLSSNGTSTSPLDLSSLTAELTNLIEAGITDPTELIETLGAVLDLPIGLQSLFPTGLPSALSTLFPSGLPTDAADLLAQLTALFSGRSQTAVPSPVASALPPSVLAALLAALQKRASETAQPTRTAASGCTPSAVNSRCIGATAKVKVLKKRLHTAKQHHQRAKVRKLTRKLRKARTTRRHVC